MKNRQSACTERYRREGLRELVAELNEFSYDGLLLLRDDLMAERVIRGSWAGCVLSYKRGIAGSTRRDRLGRARNALTVLWDSGWLTEYEVLTAVWRELSRRRVNAGGDDQLGRACDPRPTHDLADPRPSAVASTDAAI
jgi:hypothetical protein